MNNIRIHDNQLRLGEFIEQLEALAREHGVQRKWIQFPNTFREHFDISVGKRELALKHGALPCSTYWLAEWREQRRNARDQYRTNGTFFPCPWCSKHLRDCACVDARDSEEEESLL